MVLNNMSVENGETGVFLATIEVKKGDKMVVSTADKQQEILRGVYTILGMPESDHLESIGKAEDFVKDNPNDVSTRVFRVFNNPELPTYTAPEEADRAWRVATNAWEENKSDEGLIRTRELLRKLQNTTSPTEQQRVRDDIYFSFGLKESPQEAFEMLEKANDEGAKLHPKITLALNVHNIINLNTDSISADQIKEAAGIIDQALAKKEDSLELQAAKGLIGQLADTKPDETLTIDEVVGKGGTAVVVRARRGDEAETVEGRLFKIVYPSSGQNYSTPERALHVSAIRTRLQQGVVPLDVYESISLPNFFYEADIHANGNIVTTVVSELTEAKGVEYSSWQPKTLKENVAITRRITRTVNHLHERGIIDIDSGDLILDPDKLDIYFYDLDESIMTKTQGGEELVYPSFLDADSLFMGKPILWNPLLMNRNFNKAVSLNAAQWIDTHNFMIQFFNKLTGNGRLEHLDPNSDCYIDTKQPGFFGQAIMAAQKFVEQREYPLIDQDEFVSRFKANYEQLNLGDNEIISVYKQFKGYFNAYHRQAVDNVQNNRQIDLTGVEPLGREFSGRMELILSILEGDEDAASLRATTTIPAAKDDGEDTMIMKNSGQTTETAQVVIQPGSSGGKTDDEVEAEIKTLTSPATATRRMPTMAELGLNADGTPLKLAAAVTGFMPNPQPANDDAAEELEKTGQD